MDKNVEFNRFKAETMCRLCEIESCINYFAAGMLKRATENGTEKAEDFIDNLREYSEWLTIVPEFFLMTSLKYAIYQCL